MPEPPLRGWPPPPQRLGEDEAARRQDELLGADDDRERARDRYDDHGPADTKQGRGDPPWLHAACDSAGTTDAPLILNREHPMTAPQHSTTTAPAASDKPVIAVLAPEPARSFIIFI